MSSNICNFDLKEVKKLLEKRVPSPLIRPILLFLPEDWSCGRKAYKNGLCIFHAEEKDPLLFKEELDKELEEMRKYGNFNFTGFVFPNIDFSGKNFDYPTFFIAATFKEKVIFDSATFNSRVFFDGAVFHQEAGFLGTKFRQDAWFRGTQFQKDAYFEGALFNRVVTFLGASFLGNAEFSSSVFRSSAWFSLAKINGIADFMFSIFYGRAYFMDCSFKKYADLSFSTFHEQVFFKTSKYESGYLVFLSTIFKNPRITRIIGYPLSRISFMATDIEGILLVPAPVGNQEILDEIILKELDQKRINDSGEENSIIQLKAMLGPYITRETLQLEYKLVRKCLEENRMFTEAADLFVKEMRLARERLPKSKYFERLAHYIYEFLSRYGESIDRLIKLALSFVFLMPLPLLLLYNPGVHMLQQISPFGMLLKYLENLEAVAAVFMQIRSFKDFRFLENAHVIIEILIRIFAIIIFGNLFVAVRRRLERR
jgi:uncharacterized protein YjbI with pentapeptide repeats